MEKLLDLEGISPPEFTNFTFLRINWKAFLASRYSNESKVVKEPKSVKYVSLLFLGPHSFQIRNRLHHILHKYFPHLHFRFIFTNLNTIGSFFKHKDKLPNHLRFEIVYSFQCPEWGVRYVGSTYRSLRIRVSEHKRFSYRTGRPLTNPGFSIIWNHSRENNHIIRESDFHILFRSNHSNLRIAESLLSYKD